ASPTAARWLYTPLQRAARASPPQLAVRARNARAAAAAGELLVRRPPAVDFAGAHPPALRDDVCGRSAARSSRGATCAAPRAAVARRLQPEGEGIGAGMARLVVGRRRDSWACNRVLPPQPDRLHAR